QFSSDDDENFLGDVLDIGVQSAEGSRPPAHLVEPKFIDIVERDLKITVALQPRHARVPSTRGGDGDRRLHILGMDPGRWILQCPRSIHDVAYQVTAKTSGSVALMVRERSHRRRKAPPAEVRG